MVELSLKNNMVVLCSCVYLSASPSAASGSDGCVIRSVSMGGRVSPFSWVSILSSSMFVHEHGMSMASGVLFGRWDVLNSHLIIITMMSDMVSPFYVLFSLLCCRVHTFIN